MTTWLVTGGCGFIGRNLVARLVGRGEAVRVLDNLSTGRPGTWRRTPLPRPASPADPPAPGTVTLFEADVRDADAVLACARGCEIVVHLAAQSGVASSVAEPRQDCAINVMGTLNCLEGSRAAGVRRLVFASSSAPLGAVEPPVHEERLPRPASPYGASKLAGEAYCTAYFHCFGLETVILRFGNVYGPGSDRKSSVVAAFLRAALAGEPLVIQGDGRQTRDFIFVDDLVEAIWRAAVTPGIGGQIFQIATARETSVAELAQRLQTVLTELGVPGVALRYAAARLGDTRRSYADTSKARSMLGWQSSTPLDEGLRRAARWFLERADAPAPSVPA